MYPSDWVEKALPNFWQFVTEDLGRLAVDARITEVMRTDILPGLASYGGLSSREVMTLLTGFNRPEVAVTPHIYGGFAVYTLSIVHINRSVVDLFEADPGRYRAQFFEAALILCSMWGALRNGDRQATVGPEFERAVLGKVGPKLLVLNG